MAKDKNVTGEEILDICSAYMSADDLKLVEKAWHYATDAHSGQSRQSGEPYIIHPIQVAGILADLHLDAVTVACGFLHDVVEDTEKTLDDLEADFGTDVRNIVDGVTKLGKVEYKSHEEQLAENHRKMLMAMSKDIRVILVKLAGIVCTICVPLSIFVRISKSAFLAKLWKSMLLWLTVWVSAVSNGNWKIWPSVILMRWNFTRFLT